MCGIKREDIRKCKKFMKKIDHMVVSKIPSIIKLDYEKLKLFQYISICGSRKVYLN